MNRTNANFISLAVIIGIMSSVGCSNRVDMRGRNGVGTPAPGNQKPNPTTQGGSPTTGSPTGTCTFNCTPIDTGTPGSGNPGTGVSNDSPRSPVVVSKPPAYYPPIVASKPPVSYPPVSYPPVSNPPAPLPQKPAPTPAPAPKPPAPAPTPVPAPKPPAPAPTPVPAPKPPAPPVVTSACRSAANQSITVGGMTFKMTAYSEFAYAVDGNKDMVTTLEGRVVSILNSFSVVKNGVRVTPTSLGTARGQTEIYGNWYTFSTVYKGNYLYGSKAYNTLHDMKPWGACLARYGSFSGGYPLLVIP